MRLLEAGVLGIVAVDAERRSGFGQVEVELRIALHSNLMSRVAGIAAHVERRMAAASCRNVQALRVAGEAEVIVLGSAGDRLPHLVLVVGGVWIVALEAIADCRAVDSPLQLLGVLVAVAGQAKSRWHGGDQLDVGGVLVDADLMAAQASRRDSGVDGLALGLVLMAFQALGCVRVLFQRNGMDGAEGRREIQGGDREE